MRKLPSTPRGQPAGAFCCAHEAVLRVQGRLIDHLRNTASVALDELAFLVLDEADRLLDMGFTDEVCCPTQASHLQPGPVLICRFELKHLQFGLQN